MGTSRIPFRRRLLASTVLSLAAACALAGQASAQTPETPPDVAEAGDATEAADEVEAVVVTGSRIARPNLTSASPVQVVSAEEIAQGGRPVTADILNQLPQVAQNPQIGFSSTSNTLQGAGGTATVDLRGLGQQRTLVLVDGRRLGIGDPNTGNANPSPDVNQIPSQLIKRVEVLTGGASATYGSDAVAGVVNFVMERDFEGFEIDVQRGIYQHSQHNDFMQNLLRQAGTPLPEDSVWDGHSTDLSLVVGVNTEGRRGNVTGYFTYHDQAPVTQGRRDYSGCQLNVNALGTATCAGSSNSNLFYDPTQAARYTVVGNQFLTYPQAGSSPPPLFNSNQYTYLIQQDTRYTGGFFARYDVNEHAELYAEFNMMNDRANVQIAPTGLFQNGGPSPNAGFLVNCNNPLMSAQQQATFCTPAQIAAGDSVDLFIGRRNIEGGGRNSFYEHQNYRAVVGARGDLFGPWTYDLYGSYYYTTVYTASENYLSLTRLQNALQVVNTPNGPQCVSGAPCVPYNIFTEGAVTPEALAYLDITGTSRGSTTQRIVEGTVSGDLDRYGIRSPWASEGVNVVGGFQHRRENLVYAPDAALLSGDLSGGGGASVTLDNSISVSEVFAETRVPLVQDRPFADDLLLELGYRYSDYSTGVGTDTYKLALQYAPTGDVRFRASYQVAIRAPSLLELYTPQTVTNSSQVDIDPCAPTTNATGQLTPATASLEQCRNTGVTPEQYGNGGTTSRIAQCVSGQCGVLTGGNPLLNPERSETVSLGFTLTPRTFLRGFIGSLDYYNIKLEGAVGAIPLGNTLNRCLTSGESCNLIVRTATGALSGNSIATGGYIVGTNGNVAAGTTEGVDFQAAYAVPLETWNLDRYGDLSFSFAGSYLLKATTVPVEEDPEYNCAGLYGPSCASVLPEWRHTLRVAFTTPDDLTLSAAWRYIGGVGLDQDSGEPGLNVPNSVNDPNPDQFSSKLPARSYLDLSAIWRINPTVQLRAGVNNVLDQDPPLVRNGPANTGQPNTFQTYDLLGRQIFAGVTVDF